MTQVLEYADLFKGAARGVVDAQIEWTHHRPDDPNLVQLWLNESTRLGNLSRDLTSAAEYLYDMQARADLQKVEPQLQELQQETRRVYEAIGQIKKINQVLDVLGKFATFAVSIGAFVALPNPATGAAVVSQLSGLVTAIEAYSSDDQKAAFADGGDHPTFY